MAGYTALEMEAISEFLLMSTSMPLHVIMLNRVLLDWAGASFIIPMLVLAVTLSMALVRLSSCDMKFGRNFTVVQYSDVNVLACGHRGVAFIPRSGAAL